MTEQDIALQKRTESQQKAAEALNEFVQDLIQQGYTLDLEYAPQLFFRMYFKMTKNDTGGVEIEPNKLAIIKCHNQ